MEETICQICFLCGEPRDDISYQYTEPICEDCLNFKGLTRIEAVIGNKRRLKNEGAKAVSSSVEVLPSSASPTRAQIGKRNSKSSVDTDVSDRKSSPGRKFISSIKKTESKMVKTNGGNEKPPDDFNSRLEITFAPPEKESVQPECKLESNMEEHLGIIIPLSYKEIEISPHKELPLQTLQLTKLEQDQKKISESFAQLSLSALSCGLSCKKLMFPMFKSSTNRSKTPKLNLKRSGSDLGYPSRKK